MRGYGRNLSTWGVVGLTLALAGCGKDATAPAPPHLSDATTTAAQLNAIAAPTNTGVLLSLEFASLSFAPAATGPAGISPLRAAVPFPRLRGGRGGLAMLTVPRALVGRPSGAAIFPDSVLGKTFVWDTAAHRYAASSTTGAPANGVRFVLYVLDPTTFLPAIPLTVDGDVDLTDQSTPSASVLGVTVLGPPGPAPVTYAAYTISVPSGLPSNMALAGFLTDGTTRLDLTATLNAGVSSFTAQTTVDVAALAVHMTETASVSGTASVVIATDLTVMSGGQTVRANGSVTIDSATASLSGGDSVTVDGRAFATITVQNTGLGYVGAPGVTLTAADKAALLGLFETSVDVFAMDAVLSLPAQTLRL